MTTLPAATDFTGASVTEEGFKTALTDMRAYLNDMFGSDSTLATARTAFGLSDAATTTVADIQAGASEFDSGTIMLFYQSGVPTGWTLDASKHEYSIMAVDNSTLVGGTNGGSWTISGIAVDGHTLTIAEMPAHTHGKGSALATHESGSTSASISTGLTDSTGGDGAHNHGVTFTPGWRPLSIRVIICSKD